MWHYAIMAVAVIALLIAVVIAGVIHRSSPGDGEMTEIAKHISDGAMAFLMREYRVILIGIVAIFFVLLFVNSWQSALSFVVGAVCSTLAGFFGMKIATKANVRTANAAKSGMNPAFKIAFFGGSIMGMAVVGLGLLGLGIVWLLFRDASIAAGYGFGASFIALFGRVGGGIYTKAADVGADLVGKVEAGIPEDDPRNPAVIADNVGDNVGDVAGMGADLFESYVGAIISALILSMGDEKRLGFTFCIAATGALASIIGNLIVGFVKSKNPHTLINAGTYIGGILFLICACVASKLILGNFLGAAVVVTGLVVGMLIGKITAYFTSADYKPVKNIADQSQTGAATNIISGMSSGMMSTGVVAILISIGIFIAYQILGVFGIALAAIGMLAIAANTIAVDAYGPIADNAGGIAEMAGLDESVRDITDQLDSVGNTTAAIGKGFAIGSAALTALALFISYSQAVGLDTINILDVRTVIGLLLGGMLPFVFSALTMSSVGKAANKMIVEVRRQFQTIKGLLEGKAKPDYVTCVDISTKAALHQMILPAVLAVLSPVVIGLLLGPAALGGLLAGALVCGVMLAIYMANAGGAWDNAKKYIETGAFGGKGSNAHKAAVTGDTVGDPLKDTSGPSINILIKLMTVIALLLAPIL
jgi:K(+)-stimulated pyrophosphate-energized sodium pump